MITFDPVLDCPDRCCACHVPLIDIDPDLCACCGASVCRDCAQVAAGLVHCPDCAASAHEFINGGEQRVATQMPQHGETQFSFGERGPELDSRT